MSAALHIAVLDDEVDITTLISNYLQGRGYRVSPVHSGRDLMALLAADPPAVVLLDLGLPGEDGLAVARQVRERSRCGLVIVTGRGDAVDKVVGLEIGADDYVTKPFDLRELLARITAILRRTSLAEPFQAPPSVGQPAAPTPGHRAGLVFAGFTLDTAARSLTDGGGADIPLTTGEFELLKVFAEHPGRVLSRDFLLQETRGRDAGPFDRTIDVQVGRLRRKLEADADDPKIIKSVRGAGYVLAPEVAVR